MTKQEETHPSCSHSPVQSETCVIHPANKRNRKEIVLSENRSTYKAVNPQKHHACVFKVDGCLIKEGARCDYLMILCEHAEKRAWLIELKGSDEAKAVSQIETTLDSYKELLKEFKVYARIILTRYNTTKLKFNLTKSLERQITTHNKSFEFDKTRSSLISKCVLCKEKI